MVAGIRTQHLLQFAIGLIAVLIINQLINRFSLRLDLTEEKRYTISPATLALLKNLEEPVFVEVFLEGELPNGFKRLQKAIDATLDLFNYYANVRIDYSFKDPSIAKNTKARNEYYRSLIDKGLQPTNLSFKRDGNKTERLVFPGALISYMGKEKAVTLLKGNQSLSAEEQLNQSIEGIEYELANTIRILASDRRKRIGMIEGHDEPDASNLAGLNNALLEKYDLYHIDLPQRKTDLDYYDAIILPKPTTKFSEQEKFKIDQYIMHGGKALFFLDALRVNMDSAGGEGTYAFPYELNLDDMLFKYGVRINRNFVQDISSGNYPVVAGNRGDQPQIRMLPWPFFPVINNFGNHPIVKNMDAIYMKFVSNIDTVKATGVKKTALLKTSQYSRVVSAPVRVAFNDLQRDLDPARFSHGEQPVAWLLEGQFTSIYKNRILPKGANKKEFSATSENTSVLICSDGDMLRNDFSLKNGDPLDLGVDPYSNTTFANKDFVLNALEYMLNDQGLITAKGREIKIRPLDKVKIEQQKLQWQLLNLGLPMALLFAFGLAKYLLRKRKYANFK